MTRPNKHAVDIAIKLPSEAACSRPKYIVHYRDGYYWAKGDTDEMGIRTEVEYRDLVEGQEELFLSGFTHDLRDLRIELQEHCGNEIRAFFGEISTKLGSKLCGQ